MNVSVAQAIPRQLNQEQAATIRAQLAVILASESFSSSKQCQRFLQFVVEHAISGDFDKLTERFLGVELFGRPIDYETATDSIVRVRANDVRRRLAQYHSRQLSAPQTRIDLVAGGYVPEFHWQTEDERVPMGLVNLPPAERNPSGSAAATRAEHNNRTAHARFQIGPRTKKLLWAGTIAAAIIVVGVLGDLRSHQSNFDRFWQPVLDSPGQPVLNLPTTDTMQLALDPMRTLNALNRLAPGETLNLRREDMIGFHDWHVSIPVVQATLSVVLALERKGKTPLVRIGTDMRRDELRGHSIIAIGSFSNPWTKQNVSGLRFTFDRGPSDRDPPRIRDSQNAGRIWSLAHTYPEAQAKDYAIITRTFDPVTHEPFVSLAGLHSFGNQIAGEFVAQESSWNAVAHRAPPGWEKMNMQVLLETDIIDTTPGSPRILDLYFWK